MSVTPYIGIESFNHFNDNIYKKIIINRIFFTEDISNIVKDFLFITKEEKKTREIKENICNTFRYAYVSTRKIDDYSGRWAFCEIYYSKHQFQAKNCKFCGEYISTRTYESDDLCANNAKCGCVYINLGVGLYFNWSYNEMV